MGGGIDRVETDRALEVAHRALTVATLDAVAAAEQPHFGLVRLCRGGVGQELQRAIEPSGPLVADRSTDQEPRALGQPAGERANEQGVGLVERFLLREQQVAQVPGRRSEIGVNGQRRLERLDRLVGPALLLQQQPFVVERSSGPRSDRLTSTACARRCSRARAAFRPSPDRLSTARRTSRPRRPLRACSAPCSRPADRRRRARPAAAALQCGRRRAFRSAPAASRRSARRPLARMSLRRLHALAPHQEYAVVGMPFRGCRVGEARERAWAVPSLHLKP